MKALQLFAVLLTGLMIIACTSPRDKAENKINDLETVIYSDTTGVIDKNMVSMLIDQYIDFVNNYPEDPQAPIYLYSAANVSMNLMDSHKAIELFDRLMLDYPDYEKASECLFMKAFIYDNNMQEYDKAKDVYLEFLEKYPDDEFADDAKASIDNLGKSLEEIIEEFEKKNLSVSDSAV